MTGLPFSPPGTEAIAAFAARRALAFQAHPDEAWFRALEPYDTLAPPASYFNACAYRERSLGVVLVEPYYGDGEILPLERAVFAVASHPRLTRRAAARVGEHAVSRALYLEGPPPPTVEIGDPRWDAHVKTLAASGAEADAAFSPPLRALLARRGFRGHLEIRPGALVVHDASLSPTPEGYERALRGALEVVNAALASAKRPGRG